MDMEKGFKTSSANMESIHDIVVRILEARPFCGCYKKEQQLYNAWCSRVGETVENIIEE